MTSRLLCLGVVTWRAETKRRSGVGDDDVAAMEELWGVVCNKGVRVASRLRGVFPYMCVCVCVSGGRLCECAHGDCDVSEWQGCVAPPIPRPSSVPRGSLGACVWVSMRVCECLCVCVCCCRHWAIGHVTSPIEARSQVMPSTPQRPTTEPVPSNLHFIHPELPHSEDTSEVTLTAASSSRSACFIYVLLLLWHWLSKVSIFLKNLLCHES